MSKLVKQTENELKIIIENAVNKAMASGDLPQAEIPQFNIEKPANRDNGDYSTNVAMAGARAFKKAPKMIAEAIEKYLELGGTVFEKIEIAGPGFMNFKSFIRMYLKMYLPAVKTMVKAIMARAKKSLLNLYPQIRRGLCISAMHAAAQ